MKTSELTGAALDWAVSKCEGWETVSTVSEKYFPVFRPGEAIEHSIRPYSTDWSQGGPLIEREGITCGPWTTSPAIAYKGTDHGRRPFCHVGPTPLIAAMRCYVASKLGDKVEVPDELL